MSEKAVMISIRPEWCELILSGKKTVEIRKTFPHDHMPFKCYIYCTKGKHPLIWPMYEDIPMDETNCFQVGNGRVIAEFVCDRFDAITNAAVRPWNEMHGHWDELEKQLVLQKARLIEKQLHKYANGKPVYAWHISNLKVYDKPKGLRDFHAPLEDHKYYHPPFTRPPQSWCYCEEVVKGEH